MDRALENRQVRHPAARDEPLPLAELNPNQASEVLLLAAIYDQSRAESPLARWQRLRKKLHYRIWTSYLDCAFGIVASVLIVVLCLRFNWQWLLKPWPYLAIALAWSWRLWHWAQIAWRTWRIMSNTRVLNHAARPMRQVLMQFPLAQLAGQPFPESQQTDARYQCLEKLQRILRTLGFDGIVVIVDRVDEPYQVNGSTELMQALIWPMFDNKLLKHPGLGIKMLLPVELERTIDRQERDFHERARLDKQNLVRSLAWTGESLYDLANARLAACAASGKTPVISDILDPLHQRPGA